MATKEPNPIKYIDASSKFESILEDNNSGISPAEQWKAYKEALENAPDNKGKTLIFQASKTIDKKGYSFGDKDISNFDFKNTDLSCCSLLDTNISKATFNDHSDLTNVVVSLKAETSISVESRIQEKLDLLEEAGFKFDKGDLINTNIENLNLSENNKNTLKVIDKEIAELIEKDIRANNNYSVSFVDEFLKDNTNLTNYFIAREKSIEINRLEEPLLNKGLSIIAGVSTQYISNSTVINQNSNEYLTGAGISADLEIKNVFPSGVTLGVSSEFNNGLSGIKNVSFNPHVGKETEDFQFGLGPKIELGQFTPSKEVQNYTLMSKDSGSELLSGVGGFAGVNLTDKTQLNLAGSFTLGTGDNDSRSNTSFSASVLTEVGTNLTLGVEAGMNSFQAGQKADENYVGSTNTYVCLAAKYTFGSDGKKGPHKR
jgi:hypothetical protein